MSQTVGSAKVRVEADADGFGADLARQIDKALAGISKQAESAFSDIEDSAGGLGGALGKAGEDGADQINRALNRVDGSSLSDLGETAATAGAEASSAIADSMSEVSGSAADAAGASAASMAQVGEAASSAGVAASSAMAGSMSDISGSAAEAASGVSGSFADTGSAVGASGAQASAAMAGSMSEISGSAASAFASVSSSAAEAASAVAGSAADMSSSMSGALSGVSNVGTGATAGMSGLGGAIGGLTGKLGPAAAGLAGLAGAGATVQAGFDKLTSIEDTTASLGIILGDLDEASSLMAKLQEDNLQTPYMFDAYAAAGKTLAAFGADLEGIPGQVQALGEAAAASGGGQQVFDSMARSAGQAMATGKLSLDTINNLALGGVQGLQILANEYGVTTEEMQKMISGGMVPAQEGMDILTKGIMEGSEGAAGATQSMAGVMQEMSETTSGSMTNLVAAFTNLAAAGIEPLTPIIQTVVDGITDFIYVIIDLISGEDLPGWLGTVASVMEPIAWIAGSVTAAFLALKIGSLALAGAKWAAAAATGGLSTAMKLLMAHPIVAAIAAIAGGLIWFFTQTETGQRIWENLMDALGTAWEWLQGAFAGVWDTISEAAVGAFQWLSDGWNSLWEGLQAVWDAVGQPIVDFVKAAFGLWWEGVKLYFRLLGAAWEVLWTGLQMAWDAVGQPIVDFVVGAFQSWWDGMQIIFGWVQTGWDNLWAGVQAVYDAVIAPVVGWVMDRFESLRSAVRTAIEAVKSVIQSLADRLAAFYGEYVQPMVDRFLRGFNRIKDTVTGVKDTIVNALSDAGSWLIDTGKNIVQGLIDGITSLASTIGSAFLDMIPGWIKEPFKVALGIESPSTVFAGFGEDIGEGLVQGIQNSQGAVTGAVGDLGAAAIAGGAAVAPALPAPDVGPVTAPVDVAPVMSAPEMGPIASGPVVVDDMSVDVSGQLGGAFAEAGTEIDAAKEGVIDPALSGMAENLTGLGETAMLQAGTVSEAIAGAGLGMQTTKDSVIDPALWGMQGNLQHTANVTNQTMVGQALPSMQTAGAGVMNVKTGTIDPAFMGIQGGLQNTANAFATGTGAMVNEWGRLREGTAAPVRFAVNTVFNDGLVGMWNSVAEMIGLSRMNPHRLSFASGGIMPGYTPGRDVHRFYSPTAGLLDLSGGEAVMRPEFTRAIGPSGVNALNNVAVHGGAAGVARYLEHMSVGGYASGGVLPYLGGFRPGGVIYGGNYGGLTPITTTHAAWVGKHFPNMFTLTSALRFTDQGHHSTGRATDWQATDGHFATQMPTPYSKALARALQRTFPTAAELIHWPLDGWHNIWNGRPHTYDGTTNAQHANHVHFATHGPISGDAIGLSADGSWSPIDWGEMIANLFEEDVKRIQGEIDAQNFAGDIGEVPGGVFSTMHGAMEKTLAEKFEEFLDAAVAGEGVARWAGMALMALQRHGYGAEHLNAMLQQIDYESSGVPTAINDWDSNWIAGHPSGGLLQVIEPTYRRVRAAYPEAFKGLPDDHMFPLTNLTAGVGAVRLDWGGPGNRWPTRAGYDRGGIAAGMGLMPKHILDPERVLSPRQTEAFEAWMEAGARVEDINRLVDALTWREDPANLPVVTPEKLLTPDQEEVFNDWRGAGAQIDAVHDLAERMHDLQLDHPDIMGREIHRRFRDWLGDTPEDNRGDIRHLVAALESGVEWERVTQGMQRSAEAWANGQWVQVAEDKRLATPAEMGAQIHENFMEELADELGGYVGLKGLYKGRDIVGESGLMDLKLPDDLDVPEVQSVPDLDDVAPELSTDIADTADSLKDTEVKATSTPTATGRTKAGEADNIEVTVNIDVSGVNDPMAVSDLVLAQVGKGVEQAIGTARST